MNPMKLAEQYAARIKSRAAAGKDPGELLMAFAQEMTTRLRGTSYSNCKEMIRFCYDGFLAKGIEK